MSSAIRGSSSRRRIERPDRAEQCTALPPLCCCGRDRPTTPPHQAGLAPTQDRMSEIGMGKPKTRSKPYTQMRSLRSRPACGTQVYLGYCRVSATFGIRRRRLREPTFRSRLEPMEGVRMATSTTQAGRVVRVSSNGENGEDLIHELFAVAVDDDQAALDAFHQQFAVYEASAEVVGPLRSATIALLTLTAGQATPV